MPSAVSPGKSDVLTVEDSSDGLAKVAASANERSAPDEPPVPAGLPPAESLRIKREKLADGQQPGGVTVTTRSKTGGLKRSNPPEPVYCVSNCLLERKFVSNSKTPMVMCDGACAGWFHYKCLSLPKEGPPARSKWFCPECTPATASRALAPSDKRRANPTKPRLPSSARSAPLGPTKKRKKDDENKYNNK